jgi:hypothetical protein
VVHVCGVVTVTGAHSAVTARTPDSPTQRVARRVLANLPKLVQRLGKRYRAEVPEYAHLSDQAVQEEVLPVSRRFIETFFWALADRRSPDAREMPDLHEIGRRRLEMGVSLDAMLHVYRIAGRGVFEEAVEHVLPGEEAALAEIGARWMDWVDVCSSRTATGYLQASQDQLRRVEARRTAVLQALLAADTAAEVAGVAAEFSLTVAPAYVPVVALADDAATKIDALLQLCAPGSLGAVRGRHAVVLGSLRGPDGAALRGVVGSRGVVVLGRPTTPGAQLRAELEHAERVLDIAAERRLSGTFSPKDLVLEQLVAAGDRVARQLAEDVIAPIVAADRGGLFVSTLKTYLETGSIAATAKREAAHPNTITYRLRRIAELTGFDARVPREAAHLVVALTCWPSGAAD